MNRASPNTLPMSARTRPIDLTGGRSAGRAGSRKNSSVETSSRNDVADDIIRTYAIPTFSRTGTASSGPMAPPMFTSV